MARRTMKALIKEEPTKGYVLKEIPIPKPKADEVLYKVEKVKSRDIKYNRIYAVHITELETGLFPCKIHHYNRLVFVDLTLLCMFGTTWLGRLQPFHLFQVCIR